MRCNNCNNENAVGSAFCMECGAALGAPAPPPPEVPQVPPPAPGPQPPGPAIPVEPQVPPPPYPAQMYQPPRVATVKSVHLGEVLFLISAALLLVAGFENFASLSAFVRGQYVLLGMFAIIGGLIFLGMVIMPYMLKPIERYLDMIVLGLSAIFLFWGVAAMFGGDIGFDGGQVFIGGLFGLAGMGLKMGIIR